MEDPEDENNEPLVEDEFDMYLDWVPPEEIPALENAPLHESDVENFWNRVPRTKLFVESWGLKSFGD